MTATVELKGENLMFELRSFMRAYRMARNMSQEEMGHILGVASSTVSHYENGERKITLETIADYLGVLGIDFSVRLVVVEQTADSQTIDS